MTAPVRAESAAVIASKNSWTTARTAARSASTPLSCARAEGGATASAQTSSEAARAADGIHGFILPSLLLRPHGLVDGDHLLGGSAGDDLADRVEREVVGGSEVETRLSHVHLLAALLERVLQTLALLRIAVGARQVKRVGVFLRSEARVGQRLLVVRVGIALERDLVGDHSPIHRLSIALRETLPDYAPHLRDLLPPIGGKAVQILL